MCIVHALLQPDSSVLTRSILNFYFGTACNCTEPRQGPFLNFKHTMERPAVQGLCHEALTAPDAKVITYVTRTDEPPGSLSVTKQPTTTAFLRKSTIPCPSGVLGPLGSNGCNLLVLHEALDHSNFVVGKCDFSTHQHSRSTCLVQ